MVQGFGKTIKVCQAGNESQAVVSAHLGQEEEGNDGRSFEQGTSWRVQCFWAPP